MPNDEDCDHTNTEPDPETHQNYCTHCGLFVPDRPIKIGDREIPPAAFLRKIEIATKQLDTEILEKQQQKNQLRVAGAKVRDIKCAWPGCEAAPMFHGKWCPDHQHEHRKQLARERQRRHRQAVHGIHIE